MFAFDQSALPQLTTRKALIVVDLQNDFVAADGALPAHEPDGFVDRTASLAAAFRGVGDVVWVQSRFEEARLMDPEQIVATDVEPKPARPSSRARRKVAIDISNELGEDPDGPADPEAFLSHAEPTCLKPSSSGCDMPAGVKDAVQKNDLVLTKTHYSAFQATHLLRMLRAKMVMEVFICGSLANVGVYASAIDAAGHGMTITIVEDCCGYRSEKRQATAIRKLIDLTGCEVASYEEVLESIHPRPKSKTKAPKAVSSAPTPPSSGPSPIGRDPTIGRSSATPDIVRPMTDLRLASNSPSPAVSDAASPSIEAAVAVQPDTASHSERAPSKLRETIGSDESGEPKEQPDSKRAEIDPDDTTSSSSSSDKSEANRENTPSPLETREPAPVKEDELATQGAQPQTQSTEARSLATTTTMNDMEKTTGNAPSPDSGDDDEKTEQKGLCDGDTDIIENLLPASLEEGIFEKLREEVRWQRMSHQGGEVPRLVAVQGQVAEDGSIPVYRHPSDESPPLLPFSPTVLAIKAETEKHLGHPLNHVLIQHYRDGKDYISEHSDKTLDIVRGSYIANVSLGAQRTMVLRTKRPDKDPSRTGTPTPDGSSKRTVQRAKLPHNSLCRMGLRTNMKWLHSIRQDKRADREKTPSELAYSGARISLTFRHIGTFLARNETLIWGQGATGKARKDARAVINGQTPEAIKLLQAFGTENHASTFDWDAYYGKGFDVLHMSSAPRLFASTDPITNMRVSLMLAEFGIAYAKGSMTPPATVDETPSGARAQSSLGLAGVPIKYVDNDAGKSVVYGDLAIMLYLDACHGKGRAGRTTPPQLELANRFTRFQQGLLLRDKWRRIDAVEDYDKAGVKLLKQELGQWDVYAADIKDGYLAGSTPSLPDFALWPVLHAIVEKHGVVILESLENLRNYYHRMADRESSIRVMGKTVAPDKKS